MSGEEQILLAYGSGGGILPPPVVPTCDVDAYYTTGPTADPYWNNVVLLMYGNGSNGQVTTVDSSPVARAITVAGSAQLSTAQVKYGTASLDASASTSSRFTAASSADFAFGTGDFTIEFWVRLSNFNGSAGNGPYFVAYRGGLAQGWYCGSLTSTGQFFYAQTGSATINGPFLSLNTWYHIAVVRRSGTLNFFIDGVPTLNTWLAHTTDYTNDAAASLAVCGDVTNGNNVSGYMDDVRITKGVGRYQWDFTPPPAQLPNSLEGTWSESAGRTSMMLHAEALVDSCGYQKKIVSLFGAAAITSAQKKFGSNSFQIEPTGGTTSNSAVRIAPHHDFNFGTSDFTIECWGYRISNVADGVLFRYDGGTGNPISLVVNTSGIIILNYYSSGGAQANINSGVTFTLGQWNNIVIQRRSNNWELYYNGTIGNTTAVTGGGSSTVNITTRIYTGTNSNLLIGKTSTSNTTYWYGYIDEFRLTKNVSRYSANFTPSILGFCDSAAAGGGSVPVSGTERLYSVTATGVLGTLTVKDPWVKLSGVFATGVAGNLVYTSNNKTAALTGVATTGQIGSIAVAAYPELSTSNTLGGVAVTNLTITFTTTGYINFSSNDPSYVDADVGTWIDVNQTNYSISDIAHQYRIVLTDFGGGPNVINVGVLSVDRSVSFLETTGAPHKFQLTVVPINTNPRYGEPYYFGVHSYDLTFPE